MSTFATAHWLPTQWLSEVVMARTEDWFGLAGVAWLFGPQLVALMTTLYLVARRWVDPLIAVPADRGGAGRVRPRACRCGRRSLSFLLVA